MKRRAVLRLMFGASTTVLLSACAAPAALEPAATVTPVVPPTSVPTVVLPTATLAPPTVIPTATLLPTPVLAPLPTPAPTQPTAVTAPTDLAVAVDAAMQRAIQGNVLPGGVVLVRHKNSLIMLEAYGLTRKYDSAIQAASDPIVATTDTLYDLASITKLFTSTYLMRLVEQGRLDLDQPVAHWLADFAAGGKSRVTLRQLLTHTSGLPDLVQLWNLESTPQARMQRVLATPLLNPPDTVLRYSDLGLIALGHLVEQIAGVRLDQAIRDMVTGPLHLDQTMYLPSADLSRRIAPTEDESALGRGMVWGEVDDANAWSLGGIAGHAGLFGTAQDLGRLAQLYLDGGVLDGVRLLMADTVAQMTRNQIGKLGWRGLGWELNADYYMGHLASPQTYGHTGYTGTSVVIDPRRQLIVVLLTNRVHPTADGPSVQPTRQAVADAVLAWVDAN